MDRFDYYKEVYYKELENRNDINNSLSLPIGLITGMIAGLFYFLTAFNYKYSVWLSAFFISVVVISVINLVFSIYYLIQAYCKITKGYDYSILADSSVIDSYYLELKNYYSKHLAPNTNADEESKNYLISEMVRNTDDNQKNNKEKGKHRYNCEKYLIISFIALTTAIPFFTLNYIFKPSNNIQEVKIVSYPLMKTDKNLPTNRNFILDLIKDSAMIPIINNTPSPKPTPPPSQVIKEGSDPKPKGTKGR